MEVGATVDAGTGARVNGKGAMAEEEEVPLEAEEDMAEQRPPGAP